MTRPGLYLALPMLFGLISPALAAGPQAEIKPEWRNALVAANAPAMRAQTIQAGEERASLCRFCHGADGNSARPEVPKLAGQNPMYLLVQLDRFAKGERKDPTMQQLAQSLSLADRINLVTFYGSLPVKPVEGLLADQIAAGQKTFASICQNCHGSDGHGDETLPRVAGQQPTYVRTTLRHFKTRSANRVNPLMTDAVKGLSDADIDAVAAYVASLK